MKRAETGDFLQPLEDYKNDQKFSLTKPSDAFRDVYRWRAGIEATMSRLKYQMNLAHLRIRGMPAMRYVVNLRALGLNIRRCAAIAP